MSRTSPATDNAKDAAEALGQAAMDRIKKVGVESPRSQALGIAPESIPLLVLKMWRRTHYPMLVINCICNIDTGEHVGGLAIVLTPTLLVTL